MAICDRTLRITDPDCRTGVRIHNAPTEKNYMQLHSTISNDVLAVKFIIPLIIYIDEPSKHGISSIILQRVVAV